MMASTITNTFMTRYAQTRAKLFEDIEKSLNEHSAETANNEDDHA